MLDLKVKGGLVVNVIDINDIVNIDVAIAWVATADKVAIALLIRIIEVELDILRIKRYNLLLLWRISMTDIAKVFLIFGI